MKYLTIVVLSGLVVSACSGSSSYPVSPSPLGSATTAGSISGTWTGTSADTSGQEKMSWTVTQNGNSMTADDELQRCRPGHDGHRHHGGHGDRPNRRVSHGRPNGGFSGMMSSCSMRMDGQATMSEDGHTMTGTYSGNMSGMMSSMQSCGGAMNNGQFTLTR